jgi:hypothetical protein
VTVAVLLGYGGYAAWNALTGDSASSGGAASTAYVPSTQRAIYYGAGVVGLGLDVHILKDLDIFQDSVNRAIDGVRTERANLDALAATATGPQADILRSSVEATDTLESGMVQWRDAIFNLRLGGVDTAQSTIDSAVAQLAADIDRWNALEG